MRARPTLYSLLMAFAIAAPATAQDITPRLALELNRIDQLDAACRLTFLVENALGTDLAALALETVLIDAEGRVDRLTLFEFGALPDGVPRVRQFDVPGLSCDGLGRVLINGVAECSAGAACANGLELSTRMNVEVIG
ncbi:hypothetical protein GTA62_18300 [Roseobacter sp. HKCCD9010]|uniref:hypothetical protein n=1 Tax=unclassified Roseobacter TaxID=196798 RepID=UPI001490A89F|nr:MULTISPECIES: hypothetical protein [unclassified Roseobacter]MBF9051742.1 hypothetical protein [Rhodobacterales bacterium HKCCD4356]NNV13735.1 hypothetical protein [Roseobacter sp. HKCCD7357]NNV17760.1 hypothetical protein [Roseobacter sp. HKCCD8768]NNV27367.1 hypothetical protein [Roseobacter sp. HKCCD8192]NNV31487.1 hypothetical protein [Roseobacter sp. HKCCD9061]